MADYDNTNRGSIWKNEKREKDTHPDFTGSLNVAGVEYWVSAWKRKDGASPKAPALSFSVKPKDEQRSASMMSPAEISQRAAPKRPDPISSGRKRTEDYSDSGLANDMSDEIPF